MSYLKLVNRPSEEEDRKEEEGGRVVSGREVLKAEVMRVLRYVQQIPGVLGVGDEHEGKGLRNQET